MFYFKNKIYLKFFLKDIFFLKINNLKKYILKYILLNKNKIFYFY